MIESPLLEGVVHVSLVVLSLSVLVAFVRVLRGPSLPDRVVAIDFASYVTMGFLGTYAILSGREAYIDAALVLGLLAFLGTLAMARYIEGRSETEHHASAYQSGEYFSHREVGGARSRKGGRPDEQTQRARRRAERTDQARSSPDQEENR